MKVVILAGGQGTRLREETEYRPKPLVEVGGKPIIWHIMKLYAHYGFLDFIVCLGYRGKMLKEYFLNYEAMNNDFTIKLGYHNEITYHNLHEEKDFRVTLAETGLSTMTGGRVKLVEKYIDDDIFMATYGDGLADVNIKELVNFHKEHGKLATVTTILPLSRFGVLDIDRGARVLSFGEKRKADSWVSAGFFVFDRRVFDYISGPESILERQPLERLAADGQLMSYHHNGFFQPMDTYKEYLELNRYWDLGQAPWKVW
ncbi:glucose-1-phosphate cytidylyltransferase [Okeania sp. SIO1I7]|uniref:glucose-1-phosphate cytidylyltransferase n=1 Tax=Okeania sp. SIO1I7 TaxID=2607772 RepID=UPI0013F7EDD1|nr:glucose-1-phosphate cytidylyltransferase [Okeania sp. SIO1I7]NET24744.1 glucose-1-phosphate cytidylyltransferase [Okeania sp. SIO1I7]